MLCYWSVSYFKLFVSVCVVCVLGGGVGRGGVLNMIHVLCIIRGLHG
jgi:hypothetical protein